MKVAESEGIHTKRGPYHKPRRDLAKKEIRRLIVDEGLTNRQISERLNIPQNTIERYIKELYQFDNQLLVGLNSDEEVITQLNICRDRLSKHKQDILDDMNTNYKDAPLKDKAQIWNLICELECVEAKFSQEAPAILARRQALPYNNPLIAKGSNAVNIKKFNYKPLAYSYTKEEQEEDEGFEDEDFGKDEEEEGQQ